jgi:hypothetical protein
VSSVQLDGDGAQRRFELDIWGHFGRPESGCEVTAKRFHSRNLCG